MIDVDADRPAHRQLADLLRQLITSGQLPVGGRLLAEGSMAQQHGVSRGTAREAMDTLRREALIVTRRPYGTRVRSNGTRQLVKVGRPSDLIIRPPTPAEQRELNIDEMAQVAELTTGGYPPVVYVAALTEFSFR